MRKLFSFFVAVVALLIAIDLLFGYLSDVYVKKYGLHGDYKSVEYVIKECKDDVLLIGSSVVINSLMPTVIEDSLGVTCFNTGANSQTLPYFHTILNCILRRYTPKMIVLGLRPDELSGEDIGRYNLLVPYYHTGINEIDSILESQDKREIYLLQSNLYRYNTIWFRILLYHFIRGHENTSKGFLAHEKPLLPPYMTNSAGSQDVSVTKIELFTDIIDKCKERGIEIVVYSPPMYTIYKEKTGTIKELERICGENNIPYYYDTQDKTFLDHQDWFYDNVHLNKYGALEYSKIFASRLKKIDL